MTNMPISKRLIFTLSLIGTLAATPAAFADEAASEKELAQQSQNPIANLISVALESNLYYDVGPEDGTEWILNIKPVIPTELSDEFMLVNRVIAPVIYQEERFDGEDDEFGLGDFTYQGFIVPKSEGDVMWGVGPALVVPTATDKRLGSERWSLGPALVGLWNPEGPWLVGALVSQVQSFAGDSDRDKVSFFSLQYFINYTFPSGWYLSSTPTITSNWEGSGGNKWTVPFGGGAGKVLRIGDFPIDLSLKAFYNVENPKHTADWQSQLTLKLLFPKG
jgi:hypothetical protein